MKQLLIIAILLLTSLTVFTQTLEVGKTVSFQSVNFPSKFIRHTLLTGVLSDINSELDQKDATFKVVAALDGKKDYFSFESVNFPDHYLRHTGFILRLHKKDGSELFNQDASFKKVAGLAGEGVSFESSNFPGRYIRQEGFALKLHPQENSDTYGKDASFILTSPKYGSTSGTGEGVTETATTGTTDNGEASGVEEYYRVDNLTNPKFTKLDKEKAKAFIVNVEDGIKENEKLKRRTIYPKNFSIPDMGYEVYIIKLDYSVSFKELMMSTYYQETEMMNPKAGSYNPTRAGNVVKSSSNIPINGDELRGGQQEGFVILKAKDLDAGNPPKKLTEWVKNYLDGIFGNSTPKLKLSISSDNELSICLGMGKINAFKEQNGKLSKIRSLDVGVGQDLIAFTRGADNKYCIITSNGKSDNTNMHSFKGAEDTKETKNLKLWDEHRQDILKERPYPTLDYANGEYLFQYYLHMWEASMNSNLHSSSFRLIIKADGSVEPRTWQTSHTFGMDALHNGTDWVSLYSTDSDFYLNHPGVFIDKFNKKQKALLFSSPQRWAEPGQGDASHGQMNYFYTGLGGIAYDGSGYGVVFNNPKMTTAPANLPQNVGFVYVKGEFESTLRREKSDLSVDPTKNLLNTGTEDNVTIPCGKMNTEPVDYKRKVKWVSNYTSLENGFSNNTDIVAIGDKFIAVWEKWAKVGEETNSWGEIVSIWDYLDTEAAVLDKMGTVLNTKSLGKHPLNDWDDLHVQNNKVVWTTFDNANFSVHINTLDINLKHEMKELSLP